MQVPVTIQIFVLVLITLVAVSARPYANSVEEESEYGRNNLLPRLLSLVQQRFQYQQRLKDRDIAYDSEDDSDMSDIDGPVKRFKPLPQGRSGGMSLCLWKVCPAAPWLMSKRPRE